MSLSKNPHTTRRQLLRSSALGFGYVALQSLLSTNATSAEQHELSGSSSQQNSTHFPPRAKRVIFLFMKGGPSHVDTFDYKPALQRDHGKSLPFAKPRVQFAKTNDLLASPWEFRQHGQSGLPISDLFPHVARCADELCLLNSVHGTNAAHGGASLKLHTGSDSFVRPSMGSWITYGLGSENENLPAFMTICPTLAHGGVKNWGSAFLPAAYQGVPLGVASQPSSQARVKYLMNAKWPRHVQRAQLDLLQDANRRHLDSTGPHPALEARINSFELAFRMQTELPSIQEITDETDYTHSLYGLDDPVTADFGRQCLLARRFAERGVRFIQATHSNTDVQWDQHSKLRSGHAANAAEVDKPIAGLLTDLRARGLLDETLVMWGGEFGRTPVAQGSDGRDHNPEGFTVWLAGAGVRGGIRYGATDEYGYYAVENPMHLHDLHATLLWLLGIDHERLTFRHAGRDFRLTDVSGKIHTGICSV